MPKNFDGEFREVIRLYLGEEAPSDVALISKKLKRAGIITIDACIETAEKLNSFEEMETVLANANAPQTSKKKRKTEETRTEFWPYATKKGREAFRHFLCDVLHCWKIVATNDIVLHRHQWGNIVYNNTHYIWEIATEGVYAIRWDNGRVYISTPVAFWTPPTHISPVPFLKLPDKAIVVDNVGHWRWNWTLR